MSGPPPSSLLSLPNATLYSIFHFLSEGASDKDEHFPVCHVAIDELCDNALAPRYGDDRCSGGEKVSLTRNPAVYSLSCTCRRLNELYRTRIRALSLGGSYPADECVRLRARFPAVDRLLLDRGSPCSSILHGLLAEFGGGVVAIARAAADATFLRSIVGPGVRSLEVRNVMLSTHTLRRMVETARPWSP